MGCPFLFYVATLYAMLMGYVSLLRGQAWMEEEPLAPLVDRFAWVTVTVTTGLGPLGVVSLLSHALPRVEWYH